MNTKINPTSSDRRHVVAMAILNFFKQNEGYWSEDQQGNPRDTVHLVGPYQYNMVWLPFHTDRTGDDLISYLDQCRLLDQVVGRSFEFRYRKDQSTIAVWLASKNV